MGSRSRLEETEQAHHPAEGRFRALMEAASDGVLLIDPESRILFANPSVERIFGYQPDELEGTSLLELIPERFRQAHQNAVSRYLDTRQPGIPWKGVVLPALHCSGREVLVEISFGEASDGGQQVFAGFVRDVSDREADRQRLAAEHAVARILAESPDPSEALNLALESICSELGCAVGELWQPDTEGEALELRGAYYSPDLELELFRAYPVERFRRGEGFPGKIWDDGEVLWVRDVASDPEFRRGEEAAACGLHSAFGLPFYLADRLQGVMSFYRCEAAERDEALLESVAAIARQLGGFLLRKRIEAEREKLLERETEARAEAQRANREREHVLAVVSHDLRNPLNSIAVNLELIAAGAARARAGKSAPDPSESIERIRRATERMSRMIRDILELTSLEAGRLELERQAVKVDPLVSDALATFDGHDGGVRLTAELKPGLPVIWADRARVLQVIENLVHNALKFTPEGKQVRVSAGATSDRVRFEVSDQGPGIALEEQPRMFERFWRGQGKGPGQGHSGAGLGLAIARILVEAHGGEIGVESVPGNGATFWFTIPTARLATGQAG